jgi:hypothetical protein
MTGVSLAALLAVGLSVAPFGGGRAKPADEPDSRIKTMTGNVSGSERVKGVVGSIDADGLVLVEMSDALEVKERTYKPIDVLRGRQIMYAVSPRFAYRWEDVKAGDTVTVIVARDRIDKEWYCMAISISRRPKGRLPASQMEEDDDTFPAWRVANDLDNGVDVSDEEIAKAHPPRKEVLVGDKVIAPAFPGGLNDEYQAKLDAIRAKAKKKDGVKAPPPPEKK